jgi:ubiquinone/menaquinone biosynthesis C-methylase UbiE
MNWHTRYTQQANWTRGLRDYIFDKIKLEDFANVLEVGCGTGAVLSELPGSIDIHGLDIDAAALTDCRIHVPGASLVQGDAIKLPYPEDTFDVVYSHFLLLWVRDPLAALQEMKRVTRRGGYVIAFAEPNYLERIDRPSDLIPLGKWQTESLIRQGAEPGFGARLADQFFRAGIRIIETAVIQSREHETSLREWEIEWDVIESDLTGWMPEQELHKLKRLDKEAREDGSRVLRVPTYFAWGQV